MVEPVAKWSSRNGPVAIAAIEMPLAKVAHSIPGVAEHFSTIAAVTGDDANVIFKRSATKRMLARQQHSSIGRTDWLAGNAVAQPNPLRRKGIEMRGDGFLIAVATEHVKRLLDAKDKDKIRPLGWGCRGLRGAGKRCVGSPGGR